MRIEILLVPFASALSNPKKIKAGNVKEEPPPALTLMNPLNAPTANSKIKDCMSGKINP